MRHSLEGSAAIGPSFFWNAFGLFHSAYVLFCRSMRFDGKSTLRFGWETFKRRPWIFVGATAIVGAAWVGVELLAAALAVAIDITLSGAQDQPTILGSILDNIISLPLGVIIAMGWTAFFLAAHDNPDTVELSSLWHPRPFWKYVGTGILVWLAAIIGLILLIVPGVIIGLMFMFSTFIVIDRELGPIEAMKESYRITSGNTYRITSGYKWRLYGLLLVLVLINLLGLLALIVGLLATIPITMLALTHAYRVLSGSAETRPADAVPAANLQDV